MRKLIFAALFIGLMVVFCGSKAPPPINVGAQKVMITVANSPTAILPTVEGLAVKEMVMASKVFKSAGKFQATIQGLYTCVYAKYAINLNERPKQNLKKTLTVNYPEVQIIKPMSMSELICTGNNCKKHGKRKSVSEVTAARKV